MTRPIVLLTFIDGETALCDTSVTIGRFSRLTMPCWMISDHWSLQPSLETALKCDSFAVLSRIVRMGDTNRAPERCGSCFVEGLRIILLEFRVATSPCFKMLYKLALPEGKDEDIHSSQTSLTESNSSKQQAAKSEAMGMCLSTVTT